MDWLTRYGTIYEPKVEVKQYHAAMLGADPIVRSFSSGKPYDIDETKGTAKYDYESTCSRCGGKGGGEQWSHTGWTCFECGGSGKGPARTGKLYTSERLAKLNAAQEKRDATRAAKVKAEQDAKAATAREEYRAFYEANRNAVDRLASYQAACMEGTAERNDFVLELCSKLETWGKLTERQMEAAIIALDRMESRAAARAAAQWVGEVGKRMELSVTIERVIRLEQYDRQNFGSRFGQWAVPAMYLCRDENGNRIVYKGTGNLQNGRVVATISEHSEYKGEKQTIIQRPKVIAAMQEAC